MAQDKGGKCVELTASRRCGVHLSTTYWKPTRPGLPTGVVEPSSSLSASTPSDAVRRTFLRPVRRIIQASRHRLISIGQPSSVSSTQGAPGIRRRSRAMLVALSTVTAIFHCTHAQRTVQVNVIERQTLVTRSLGLAHLQICSKLTVRLTPKATSVLAFARFTAPMVYAKIANPIVAVTKRPPHAKAIASCQNAAPPFEAELIAVMPNCCKLSVTAAETGRLTYGAAVQAGDARVACPSSDGLRDVTIYGYIPPVGFADNFIHLVLHTCRQYVGLILFLSS